MCSAPPPRDPAADICCLPLIMAGSLTRRVDRSSKSEAGVWVEQGQRPAGSSGPVVDGHVFGFRTSPRLDGRARRRLRSAPQARVSPARRQSTAKLLRGAGVHAGVAGQM